MSGTHYISDPHFLHRLVSGLRGFDTPEEHDEAVCDNFVSQVRPGDITYWLGDITVTRNIELLTNVLATIASLPGKHILVPGNHDQVHGAHRDAWKFMPLYMTTFAAVLPFARRRIAGRQVMLSHFPYGNDTRHLAEYGGVDKYAQYRLRDEGKWLLHGHVHTPKVRSGHPRSIHIGLDAWQLRPVSQGQVEQIIATDQSTG